MKHPLRLQGAVEALLYATREPLTLAQIASLLDVAPEVAERTLEAVARSYEGPGRGVQVRSAGDAYQLVTRPEHEDLTRRLRDLEPPLRLSQAAWETLALVTHLQPITAAEICAARGHDVTSAIDTLLTLDLIYVAERRKAAGRPRVYRTTQEFLRRFGLRDLTELRPLEDLRTLLEQR